jgi:hypothetical protein
MLRGPPLDDLLVAALPFFDPLRGDVICQPPSRFFSCYHLSYGVQGSHCSIGTDRSAAQHAAACWLGGVMGYGLPHLST